MAGGAIGAGLIEASAGRMALTEDQLNGLVQFVEEHPVLTRGRTRPLNLSKKLWAQCAKKLNTYPNGVRKNGKQWAKTWTDIKYRTRRKALERQAAKALGRPLPAGIPPVPPSSEKRILAVLGEDSFVDVLIRTDSTNGDTDSANDVEVLEEHVSVVHVESDQEADTQNGRQPSPDSAEMRATARPALAGIGSASDDSDGGVSVFLAIEKRKISSTEKMAEAVCEIRDQMKRLTQVLEGLKDAILSKQV